MSPKTPTLAEVIRTAIENRLADVHVMLPGKIESYDPATQTADVQPMIRRFQEGAGGEAISEAYPVIPAVPVAFPRGGGFKMTFPVAAGDFCALVFCESSIDNHQAGGGREPVSPELFQRFDLTDAVAFLGWYPGGEALSSTDGDDLVLGKEGGAAIHVAQDQINLYEKSPADWVALAQKVLDELNAAKADRAGFKSTFDTHSHVMSVPAVTPGPVPQTAAPPVTGFPTPTSPNSVAASKVKAT